ncbi:Polysaccharide pyruvyl transferase [Planctomycetes bacterium CA13]|uniref:Polysaccharide pyruvyl transferase n=1 Tax=Novipirellula herctigrandis TaxID=2527986 RepID=A0A5C5Z0E5_9BACT|nr:Polysaccharide pyruvyl transferase [Planctomycetes bacterium CA13]
MTRATLIGYHGRGNFGDDIFFDVLLEWLNQHFGATKIFVSAPKESIPSHYGSFSVQCISRRFGGIARLNWLPYGVAILRSRVVCFGGGSIFLAAPFLLGASVLFACRILRPKTPTVALGVTISENSTDNRLKSAKLFFSRFDLIVTRDDSSYQFLKSLSLRTTLVCGADLALCWPKLFTEKPQQISPPDGLRIGIFLNHPRVETSDEATQFIEAVALGLKQFSNRGVRPTITLVATCVFAKDDDRLFIKPLKMMLEQNGFDVRSACHDPNNPQAVLDIILDMHAIISSRMHPGVVALGIGTPVLHISYDQKIDDFYSSNHLDSHRLTTVQDFNADAVDSFLVEAMTDTQRQKSVKSAQQLQQASSSLNRVLADAGADLSRSPKPSKDPGGQA